jgi:hypothetical protein
MPPRLNKRQQRELEELEALNLAKTSRSADVTSEDEEPGPSHRGGGFVNVRYLSNRVQNKIELNVAISS